MKYLISGSEPQKRVELIISFTKMDSEDMHQAIIDHLTKGFTVSQSAKINGVAQSNLNRDIIKLNVIAGKIEAVKVLDWVKFNKSVSDIN